MDRIDKYDILGFSIGKYTNWVEDWGINKCLIRLNKVK
jgi:hypothetical protein